MATNNAYQRVGPVSAKAVSCASSGDNTVHTTTTGYTLRLLAFSICNAGATDVIFTLKFGTGGSDLIKHLLVPGAIFSRSFGSSLVYLQGTNVAATKNLIVNLDGAIQTYANIEYDEVL